MSRILVFIFDGMTDYEITFITHLLSSDAGKEIITISYTDELIKAKSGFVYKPHKLVRDMLDEDVDGLIIPGGWYGETKPELMDLIEKLNSKHRLIGAICGAGTVYLAKSGILQNAKYTTPVVEWTEKHAEVFGEKDPFPRNNFVSERVVRDKNIITAHGTAFVDFAVEICDWFDLFEGEEEKNNFVKSIKGK
ncbi:DJ-1/PfpI family protein [Clostridium sp. 'White wine YQ']|uniref:DJ-1/PfpI family protein n=1 Tax=Clostridium sp. 'White wine YQ' TaxID=3027474 RepID=UPI0023670D71|nr:DJ-1/PfpI family protein [Clostridium sp. 'White wine YQ']MDD7793169.1 DJ-1/PfpI family protein [Clostridium sp. 'White wine YQ']